MKKTAARKIAIFPYQIECVDIIRKVSASRGRALISIAVGYGRTVIVLAALKELFEAKKIKRALIVVPRRGLQDQFIHVLTEYCLESTKLTSRSEEHTKLTFENALRDASIVVSTLAMFRKRVDELSPDLFDIMILDECQELSESDWKTFKGMKSAIIGLTSGHPLLISPKMLSFFNLQRPTYSYGISSLKLKELANVFIGANYRTTDLLEEGTWKFIRPRDVKDGHIIKVKVYVSEEFVKRNRKGILNVGDIVLQNVFDFSKIAIIREEDLPAMASRNLFVIRSTTINPNSLFDYLQSKAIAVAFRKQLADLARGAPIKHISLSDVREIPVPLPFSEEHLSEFADIKRFARIKDLLEARNEIAHLRRAYELYSKSEE
jgi:hypothetical protein